MYLFSLYIINGEPIEEDKFYHKQTQQQVCGTTKNENYYRQNEV
jgi:hypothetical protein